MNELIALFLSGIIFFGLIYVIVTVVLDRANNNEELNFSNVFELDETAQYASESSKPDEVTPTSDGSEDTTSTEDDEDDEDDVYFVGKRRSGKGPTYFSDPSYYFYYYYLFNDD